MPGLHADELSIDNALVHALVHALVARWSPYVAAALPVAAPYVVATGEPSDGYPEDWAVVHWIDGENPTVGRNSVAQDALARDLAGVVSAMRSLEVPAEALSDPALHWYRADPVAAMDQAFREAVESCRSLSGLGLDLDAVTATWDTALALDPSDEHLVHWLHGDLWPRTCWCATVG